MGQDACLSDETLVAFAAGGLSAEARERLEVHIGSCTSCGQLLAHGLESGPTHARSQGGSIFGDRESARPLGPGDAVDRYVVAERIGSGAMGVVYAAYDPQLNRTVALKVLRADGGSRPQASPARLLREARALARLVHPNVVAVYDAGEIDHRVFIAMQLVPDGTLATWLARQERSWREALAVCVSAGRGLAAAHRAGLVHRDFKPDNVLVSEDGEVRVTDFGLARADENAPDPSSATSDAPAGDATVRSLATAHGTLLGTPAYMAPEQMRCEPATARADVFSFCATTYEALYGARPFEGANLSALLGNVVRARVRAAPASSPVPAAVRRVLLRGLRASPDDRYASIDDVLSDLGRASRSWSRTGARVAALLLFVLVVGVAAFAVARPGWARRGPAHAAQLGSRARPSVAIVAMLPESPAPDQAWLEPVLSELLSSELGAGERLRVIPRETVSRLRHEFQVTGLPTADVLARLATAAGADYGLIGTYRVVGGRVRVVASLRERHEGSDAVDIVAEADVSSLPTLVAEIDARTRDAVGATAASEVELKAAHAALPPPGDALRDYAAGVASLARGELPAARAALERSLALDDASPLAHGALATALLRAGKAQAAAVEAGRAVERSTGLGRADQLSLEGLAFECRLRWDQAIDTYKALLRFYPDEIEYGFQLVRAQTFGEKWADAYAAIAMLRKLPPPAGDDPRIDYREAMTADATGDYPRAERFCDEAARKASALGERLLLADARSQQAWALIQLGDRARARIANDESDRIYADMGDPSGHAAALRISAKLFEDELDYDAAIDKAQQALALVRELGDARRVLYYLMSLAGLHGLIGELAASIREYEEVVTLARADGPRGSEAAAQSNLGLFRTAQGRFDEARASLDAAMVIDGELGSRREYYHLCFRAYLELLAGNLPAAKTAAEASAKLAHDVENPSAEADALRILGLVQHEQGEADASSRSLTHARELVPDASSQVADLDVARAAVALDDGRGREAADLAIRSEERYRRGHAADDAAKAAALACRGLLRIHDVAGAEPWCRRADERAAVSEALDVAVRVAIAHAALASAQGNDADASATLTAATARAREAGAHGLALESRAVAVRGAAQKAKARQLAEDARRRGYARLAALCAR